METIDKETELVLSSALEYTLSWLSWLLDIYYTYQSQDIEGEKEECKKGEKK